MSRAWMAQLLLMPLFVISQETCSSVTCSNNPGDPGNERLGNDTTALLHFQVASTTTTTLPACVAQINTGNCNAMNSCWCEPDINPQIIGDFPDSTPGGILQCGGQNSCQSNTATNTNFFKMSEPRTLECSGQNSCDKDFNVENVGSICVTGDNAIAPSTQTGTFKLANADPATGRINDVCCARPIGANQPHCTGATFENVGSMYCTGDGSCNNLQVTLSGDLFCRTKEGCGKQQNSNTEYWKWLTGGKHCIKCLSNIAAGTDQGSCIDADFQFPVANSYPTLMCTGFKACQGGQGVGQNPFLTLSAGSCANIVCNKGGASQSNDLPCKGMKVKLNGGRCYATGDAIITTGGLGGQNYPVLDGTIRDAACSYTEPCTNADQTCEPSFCCTSDVLDPSAVDCGPCTTSTTSTTTTTTTTTTPGGDPSSGTTTSTTTTTTSGGASGDPHIHSLYGAHYTLLREGVFVAWEFKKDLESSGKPENAVHWQLLARYGGKKFRTLGILLVDNSGHKLEFSAHDCALRAKEGDHPWYIAKPGLLLPDTASSIGVQDSRKNTTSHRTLIDARINFNITDGSHGSRKVASLYTHCILGDHLNFKITMLQKRDLVSVGGEMGVHPQALEATTHLSFLSHSASSKLRAMRTRTDEEFQAKKPWVELGGTADSDRFFHTFNHVSFVERPNDCGDEGEQEARKICAKHLPNEASNQSEVFADCIFDVCHGGGELDAELRADLMAA